MPQFDNTALTEGFLRVVHSCSSGKGELASGLRALADAFRRELVVCRDHDEMFRLQGAAQTMEDTADLFDGGAAEILKRILEGKDQ
jgi:hypothetical protein